MELVTISPCCEAKADSQLSELNEGICPCCKEWAVFIEVDLDEEF